MPCLFLWALVDLRFLCFPHLSVFQDGSVYNLESSSVCDRTPGERHSQSLRVRCSPGGHMQNEHKAPCSKITENFKMIIVGH